MQLEFDTEKRDKTLAERGLDAGAIRPMGVVLAMNGSFGTGLKPAALIAK